MVAPLLLRGVRGSADGLSIGQMAKPQTLGGVAGRTYCRAPRSLGLLQDTPGFDEEHGPGGRQRDLVVRPIQEPNAQLLLEVVHLLADGRLADSQTVSGAPEVQLIGDGDEVAKMPKFHPGSAAATRRCAWPARGPARESRGGWWEDPQESGVRRWRGPSRVAEGHGPRTLHGHDYGRVTDPVPSPANPYGKYRFDLDAGMGRQGLGPLRRPDRTTQTA